jgi:hypothetical protein
MTGILDEAAIERVLSHAHIGRIGMHVAGRTYIVPVTYAYDGISIYGHSSDGMKLRMMRENSLVCFEVERVKDLVNWESVIAWGEFEELSGEDAQRGLMRIVEHIRPLIANNIVHIAPARKEPHAAAKPAALPAIVYRIRLHEKTGRFEKP